MTRWALLTPEGVVDNVVLWDGDREGWEPPEGLVPVRIDDAFRTQPGDVLGEEGFGPAPGEDPLAWARGVIESQVEPAAKNPTQRDLNQAIATLLSQQEVRR